MPGMGLVRDGTSCGDNLVRSNFLLNLNLLIRYSMLIILVINRIMQNHGIETKLFTFDLHINSVKTRTSRVEESS